MFAIKYEKFRISISNVVFFYGLNAIAISMQHLLEGYFLIICTCFCFKQKIHFTLYTLTTINTLPPLITSVTQNPTKDKKKLVI